MEQQLICGFPDQWSEFQKRNEKFLLRLPNLQAALDLAFLRTFDTTGPEDRTVFMLGRICAEEFYEVALLAANGYGLGAQRLLRSLYERAVTMAFLSDHPDQIDAFMNYHAVAQFKLMQAIHQSYEPGILPESAVEETRREYEKVKDQFQITLCPECKTTRTNHTWHKLDVVSMAKKTIFGPLVIPGYYLPMSQAHSTVHAMLSRLEETTGGGLGFNPDPQPKKADGALMTAHNIVLGIIETQKKFFGLKQLEEPLQKCIDDFMEIWIKEESNQDPRRPEGD
jgi:hypothetical protein